MALSRNGVREVAARRRRCALGVANARAGGRSGLATGSPRRGETRRRVSASRRQYAVAHSTREHLFAPAAAAASARVLHGRAQFAGEKKGAIEGGRERERERKKERAREADTQRGV